MNNDFMFGPETRRGFNFMQEILFDMIDHGKEYSLPNMNHVFGCSFRWRWSGSIRFKMH